MANDTTGPLTERQSTVLQGIASGRRYAQIAQDTCMSVSTVKLEASNITAKFGAGTVAQAVSHWTTANAYTTAAEMLEGGRIRWPQDEAEGHVNHVLTGMAGELRARAFRLLPK